MCTSCKMVKKVLSKCPHLERTPVFRRIKIKFRTNFFLHWKIKIRKGIDTPSFASSKIRSLGRQLFLGNLGAIGPFPRHVTLANFYSESQFTSGPPVGSRAQFILTKSNELLHEHLTSMDSAISQLRKFIPFDASQRSLWISIASIAFNPTAWNIVARNGEYSNDSLSISDMDRRVLFTLFANLLDAADVVLLFKNIETVL